MGQVAMNPSGNRNHGLWQGSRRKWSLSKRALNNQRELNTGVGLTRENLVSKGT